MVDAGVPQARGIEPIERETVRRMIWRLMPLLMLGYFCAYLDRVNVGMAAATMNRQLGFSSAVYGFGAGLFFFGYFLAEIPSNLFLNKIGARRWLSRILITWGILSGLTAFVWNDWSFYGVRFFLGLAEAGYFPGVVLYLTWWFPSFYASRMIAIFYSAALASLFIGPPISGLLLQLDGLLALHGWQWLFIVEAAPPVIMCFVTWWFLTDQPAEAAWLRPDQKAWLAERLASERAQREAVHKYGLLEALANPKVLLLSLAYLTHSMASYGLSFFMPLIVKGFGVSTNWVGLVTAIPYGFALVTMNYWSWHSDRSGDKIWHAVAGWSLEAVAMAACILIGPSHPALLMVALIAAPMGSWAVAPVFWSMPSTLLTGAAAAGGIAMINSIGQLGGWFGPWVFGLVKDATGSDNIALLCLAAGPIISSVALVVVGHDRRLVRMSSRA
jgi:MFS family permease